MARLVCGALSLGTLLLWLAGCHSIPNPWQELPPPPTPLSSAAPVWEHLAARRQALDNLKGLAQVRLKTRGWMRDGQFLPGHASDDSESRRDRAYSRRPGWSYRGATKRSGSVRVRSDPAWSVLAPTRMVSSRRDESGSARLRSDRAWGAL